MQYVPAPLLTMAQIEAADLAELLALRPAPLVRQVAVQELPELPLMPVEPMQRCDCVRHPDFVNDPGLGLAPVSAEEYKVWYRNTFGFPPPADPFP